MADGPSAALFISHTNNVKMGLFDMIWCGSMLFDNNQ